MSDVSAAQDIATSDAPRSAPQLSDTTATKNHLPVLRIHALQPTIQNIGHRTGSSQKSPSDGDHEFFLDEFNAENAFAQPPVSGNFHPVDDDVDDNFQTIPSYFEAISGPTGAEGWTLGDPASGGEEGRSLLWDLPEFMDSSRSASQQGAIELGTQMALRMRFTAGRVHSMIRCSEQPEATYEDHGHSSIVSASDEGNATYAELANRFLLFNEVHPAVRPFFTVRSRDQTKSTNADLGNKVIKVAADTAGDNAMELAYANKFVISLGKRGGNVVTGNRHYCSHPGCAKQAQAQGLCTAHGGVRHCTYPDCTAISRWHGLCSARGGCSEEGCENLVRSRGKCAKHGAGASSKCSFPGCTTKAQRKVLCAAHGGSLVCKIEGCDKKALTKGLCGGHGGDTRCKIEECGKITSVRGLCHQHALASGVRIKPKGKCKVEGCVKFRLNAGYCTKHAKERGVNIGRKCRVEGCAKSAQAGGHCFSHGGGVRCTHPGCTKQAYSKGLCAAHGGRITCKVKGCTKWGLTKGAVKGYCIKHGGGTRCKHPGCNKSAQFKGLCCTHGGWCACEAEGCNKRVKWKGFCPLHKKTAPLEKEAVGKT